MWDATCPNTFAPSYMASATSRAGAVAAAAEEQKTKYISLSQCHSFVPMAIKTTGVFDAETLAFLRELGQHLQQVSADTRSSNRLIQHLSVAVQKGNSASVLSSAGRMETLAFFIDD